MPDLRLFCSSDMTLNKNREYLENNSQSKCIKLASKHLSLLDIRSFQLIYFKKSFNQTNLMDTSSSCSRANMNFSRMSRLSMLRSYMSKLGEKVKQVLLDTFNNKSGGGAKSNKLVYSYNAKSNNLYSINEETVDSYDIIEIKNESSLESETKPENACNSF